jgi:hypothetical protein
MMQTMKSYLPCCCALLVWFVAGVGVAKDAPVATKAWDLATAEQALIKADDVWMKGLPREASPLYEETLSNLPKAGEPFRPMIIMRLAKSQYADGKKPECQQALKMLSQIEYVPEHHLLAAKELMIMMETGKNPGHARTPVPPLPKAQETIEVSPAGQFITLPAALTAARKAREGGRSVEIVLAPGTYVQKETLTLGKQDSGLVIRSKDRENPAVLTGGVTLKTWTEATDPEVLSQLPESVRGKVLVCDLVAHGVGDVGELVFGGFSSMRADGGHARFKTFPVPELFHKGEPQTMARWPNDTLVKLPVETAPEKPDPRFARWAKEKDLWLYGYWGRDWADAYEKVAGIDEAGRISLVPPTNRYGFQRGMGCAVNALCEMDQPGEWHLDTRKGVIHYLPPTDFDPDQCVLSSYGTAIVADNCDDLQIRDLKVDYVRGDAATFTQCSRLLILGMDITHCSGLGLRVQGGEGHLIHSCRINSMGRGGIDFKAGDWRKLIPGNSIIENCRISRLSRIDRTYTPALLLEGMGIKVRHNSFVDIPSSAIRVEACDALIEMNEFIHCVYESGDQGAIDMWANPLYRGNIIRWNDFVDIRNDGQLGAAAVRHDDFISGFMVFENVMRKGTTHGFGAVQINRGTDNHIEGNIIMDWHKAFTGHTADGDNWKSLITQHAHSSQVLSETDWQSESWTRKYPMVRDLLNGHDNQNYLAGNLLLGSGDWGGVNRGIMFANRQGSKEFHAEDRESIRPVMFPWHSIPLERIGPYTGADAR